MKKIAFLLTFCFIYHLSIEAQPDYRSVTPFFQKYISEDGMIDYKELKKNKLALDQTLQLFVAKPPKEDWHRNEKLAYWLNVYNLQLIKLITENYPVKSILDLYGGKVWQVKCIKIGDRSYCLDEIEHDIIRQELKEPRIHFALYSGAMSSPPLLNEAFTPANMNANFEKLTKRFISSKNNVITDNKVELSMLFDWYKADFKALIPFINKYSKTQVRPNAEITYLDFDWRLRE
jgi:hypothetical protein